MMDEREKRTESCGLLQNAHFVVQQERGYRWWMELGKIGLEELISRVNFVGSQ